MRRAILSVVFVCQTVALAAQTPSPSVRGNPMVQGMSSKTASMTDKTINFTGLELVLADGTKLTADDAVMNRETRVLELSGHVTMTFPK